MVYGADGQVVMAGTITQVDTVKSGEVADASELVKLKNSSGKVVTLIVPETITSVKFTMVPGGTSATAATLAQAIAQSVLVRKMDNLVTTLFSVADLNGTFVIEDATVKVTSEGATEYEITGMKYEADFSGAVLSA